MRLAFLASIILILSCGSNGKRLALPSAGSAKLQPPASGKSSHPSSNISVAPDARPYTTVTVHHVIFIESSGLQLRAEWLRGRLYPSKAGTIPSLDDPASFEVQIEAGVTEISLPDLSATLRATVLKNSKLKDVRLFARGTHEIEIDAHLQRVISLPVQVLGEIEATGDGRLAIQIKSLKVLHIPSKGLMHALHLKLSELVDLRNSTAVEIQGESIYLDTERLLPPPRKFGHITSVHFTRSGGLQEDYGSPESSKFSQLRGKTQNFMQLEGGSVQFGKLIMRNTDMTLIDSSPGNWFEFNLARYRSQLVAGDLHMTSSGGLLVFIPGYNEINNSAKRAAEKTKAR